MIVGFASIRLCFSNSTSRMDSLMLVLKSAKQDTSRINLLNDICKEKYQAGDYPEAKKYADEALTLAENINFKKGMAESYFQIGRIYQSFSEYPKALEYYQKSSDIYELIGNKYGVAVDLQGIGRVYFFLSDYSKALEYEQKALAMNQQLENKEDMATNLNCIGIIYQESVHDYVRALEYYQKSLIINEQLGNKSFVADNLGNIGNVYRDLSDYPKALEYMQKAQKIAEELENKFLIALWKLNIGEVYLRSGELTAALNYVSTALSILLELGEKEGIREAYQQLAMIDSAMNNFKGAYEYHKRYMQINDSMFNMENGKKITQMTMQADFDKTQALDKADHEKLIAVANVEIKKQKALKYTSIGGLLIVLILSYLGYKTYRSRQLIRLQDIRNKISADLHDDIGSTLNSISVFSEVAKQKSSGVVHELDQIGLASRKIIDGMSDIVWTINPENDSFENIIDRMRSLSYNILRAKNIEFTFRADEKLNEQKLSLEDRRNFYLIFKEILNNMVKYSEATRASIILNTENNFIVLSINDNGKGFDTSVASNGNGLNNIRRRAKEMKADLTIESSLGNGTRTELKFR